jgi:16S rRNA (guanine1516-N2)-methyltransferase
MQHAEFGILLESDRRAWPADASFPPPSWPSYASFDEAKQSGCRYLLGWATDGLHFMDTRLGERVRLHVNFVGGTLGYRRVKGGGKEELLSRAVGLRQQAGLLVLDATAGLGRDSFALAGAGARVVAVEANPVLAALVADAMQRARRAAESLADAHLQNTLARLEFRCADALACMPEGSWDCVYLDPMFPSRDKSAAVKKEMQMLQDLVGFPDSCADASMLEAAWQACRYRVVVKRPRLAPSLPGMKPTASLQGKVIRYDIYAKKRLAD